MDSFDFIYGTAWKKEQTGDLVEKALQAGFVAIDTANQKKHYREDYLGERLKRLYANGLERSQVFLQSKFTHIPGQDHRLPYDPSESYTNQIQSSFYNTLENLHTDYLDSYLIHGPLLGSHVGEEDFEVWQAMESLAEKGLVKYIGLSNVGIHHLEQFYEQAKVKPKFVQNRCFAATAWDLQVRQFCQEHNITYQGFSLLTANRPVWESAYVLELANKYQVSPADIVFRFSQQIKILPLTGTTNFERMKTNLQNIKAFGLEDKEIDQVNRFLL